MEFRLDQLKALEAVADEGSFDAAAARLRVTPSAISQRIKALEGEAGSVLVRRGRPAQVTERGTVLLRLARQIGLATAEAEAALPGPLVRPNVRVAINADSLATWALPALAAFTSAHPCSLEVVRSDEGSSAGLLRDGTVMAAVTSSAARIQGCTVRPLGAMRYRAVASPRFVERWFSGGVDRASLQQAPVAEFDRNDRLQTRFLREVAGPGIDPPHHSIPGSAEFVAAVAQGMAWGLVPEAQRGAAPGADALVPIGEFAPVDVPLYLQLWRVSSQLLDALAESVFAAAARALRPLP